MKLPKSTICLLVLSAALAAFLIPAWAGGPLSVTGINATEQGKPFRWSLDPIPYRTDLGKLGNQSNSAANTLVAEAFQVWQDVGTATIHMQNEGSLNDDITKSNYLIFMNGIGACEDSSQPINSIVYDVDGSIIKDMGMDENSTLGFSGIICLNEVTGVFTRGWTVMNGRFIDGSAPSANHSTSTLEEFKSVFVHEFGHLLGLDHSQINLNCLTDISCPAADIAGLPIMFPVLLDTETSPLKPDDKAALSLIYPSNSFASTTGRIQGRVLFSDGQTPAQGYNVIARLVSNPRSTAVSCVSGFLFTAAAGNSLVPGIGNDTESIYGSRDQNLIGYYDIAGLPPGEYKIEVEAIYNSGGTPFISSSGVGPIGNDLYFQFKMPGTCDLQYLKYPSSSSDSCSDFTTISIGAGMTVNTNTDVIFLGTPPRFDAWEDEP
jgi:hypothetical protein